MPQVEYLQALGDVISFLLQLLLYPCCIAWSPNKLNVQSWQVNDIFPRRLACTTSFQFESCTLFGKPKVHLLTVNSNPCSLDSVFSRILLIYQFWTSACLLVCLWKVVATRWWTPYFLISASTVWLQKWVPWWLMVTLEIPNLLKMLDLRNPIKTLASLVGSICFYLFWNIINNKKYIKQISGARKRSYKIHTPYIKISL